MTNRKRKSNEDNVEEKDVEIENVQDKDDENGNVKEHAKNVKKKEKLSGKPPKAKLVSAVWDHFTQHVATKPEDTRAECKHCGKNLASDPKMHGTSSLWHHIRNQCPNNPDRVVDNKQKILTLEPKSEGENAKEGSLVAMHFSKEQARKAVAEYIVMSELSYRHVESKAFKKLIQRICPKLLPPSRHTISRDINKMYLDKKERLKNILKNERVSITTDTWTSIQNINYMVITAHWIDSEYNLQKRILNFCQITDHKGAAIGKDIEKCLDQWGISKIFVVTVDNASSNERTVAHLKNCFSEKKGGIVLGGKFSHMRCCAHIVNLIVNEGLKEKHASICSIRNAVRYVRSSPSRLKQFKEQVAVDKISSNGLLYLDVPTRWNSTYLMLLTAMKFKKTFMNIESDANYARYFEEIEKDGKMRMGPPSIDDWKNAVVFVKFLETFYEVTLKFSGTEYVTANKYFTEIFEIQEELSMMVSESGEHTLLGGMARGMKQKYDKYWGDLLHINGALLIAVVLDPRYKIGYLRHCYSVLHDEETCNAKMREVEGQLRQIFEEYNELHFGVQKKDIPTQPQQEQPSLPSRRKGKAYSAYVQHRIREDGGTSKNEVDRYLYETPEDIDSNLDILGWWKVNSSKYKVLSLIARDIMAIPVTTVASESAFSMGGRILDPFRSSLRTKSVEALICLRNWLSDSHQPIIHMDHMDEADVLKESENLDLEMFASPNTSNTSISIPNPTPTNT